jgi:hypothetical protein
MLRRLEGRRVIVSELDQELPRGEPGHGRPGGVHVIDAVRLECEVRRRRGHVLGICTAIEAGKAEETEDFITDGEALHIRGDGLDDARQVRPRNHGQGELRPRLRRQVGHPVAQVPVGGGDADCVHADEHLTRPLLGNRHLVVTQNFRAAVLMEPDRPHVCVGIVFSCPRCGIGLSGSAIHIYGPLI